MRQTRSRTKAQIPEDVPQLEKAIDTLNQKELRQLLNYRSSDKSSLSSLRARSYDLLRTNYSSTKSRLQTILEKQTETTESRSTSPQIYTAPVSSQSQSNNPLTSLSTPAVPLGQIQSQVSSTPYSSFQPQITSFLHQFEQFANNKNQQQTAPPVRQSYQRHIQSSQQTLPSLAVPQVIDRSSVSDLSNNGIMYQPNLNVVPPATGNGAVTLPHTNGLVNSTGYGTATVPPQPGVTQNLPQHPDVRLKKLAFFDVMATLLKPSTLIPTSNSQRMQEGTYYFHLTPQQATDIASNRDIRNSQKIEHIIQVQLRFCLLETSCEQEDYFPPNVIVKVNNKLCPLPNPIPTNKPGVEPKRPPRPVNITTNVKLSPTVANNIHVTWCTDYNRGFVISAYLVKKLTSSQLLQRMKAKGIKPIEFTRSLIKEKLKEDADCDIATTELRVSLMCPLGKMRMTTPCRASTCLHLQCFDASLFLQMNERKPTWNCPVCDKPALYETLVIDGYFQDVLQSTLLPADTNEIQLLKDGSWATHDNNSDSNCLDTPRKSTQKVEVISDDIEVIIADDSPKSSIKTQAMNGGNNSSTTAASKPNEPSSTTTGDSVDLTLSDSDDECVQVRQGNNNSTNNNSSASNKGPSATSATPVITNDAIISLDSPSPPASPSVLSARNSDFTGNGYTNISTASANLNAALLANSFDAHAYLNFPDFSSSATQSSIDRSDPLLIYKNSMNWLNQQLPSSTDWELLRSHSEDSNQQNPF
ncbi:E3 SUMO-protein ligase PIAS2 isoform X2 [Sitodiplosis mosellana]|uniref:E3 SUMO-protein ligase PIAS2 isoform X2 n=1 Tax=Sitodiplosis mosellana TaxID=263140 RepID=UPI0024447555|nr:E3 SUMO-protein ligase PIAS2 isoform X2 [Sitodiplosis mosellana]